MNENETIPENATRQMFWASAEDAWAAAWAAQRIHGEYRPINQVVFDEDENKKQTNRDKMLALLLDPSDVTDEDRANGAKAREWFQGQLFGLIGGALNDFMTRAAELAVKDEISLRKDAGVLACLPSSYLRSHRKETIQDLMAESNGQHVGSVTEKIVRRVEVLDVKKGVSFDGHMVTATDGNNFYRFCTSSLVTAVGESFLLQGKVKKHDIDRDTKTPVTWLNYAKKLT